MDEVVFQEEVVAVLRKSLEGADVSLSVRLGLQLQLALLEQRSALF